jgi:hypothetical protein
MFARNVSLHLKPNSVADSLGRLTKATTTGYTFHLGDLVEFRPQRVKGKVKNLVGKIVGGLRVRKTGEIHYEVLTKYGTYIGVLETNLIPFAA